MQYITIQYNTIQYNTIQYNTIKKFQTSPTDSMQCNPLKCNAMQYNTIQYNTIQYNAIQCNVIRSLKMRSYIPPLFLLVRGRLQAGGTIKKGECKSSFVGIIFSTSKPKHPAHKQGNNNILTYIPKTNTLASVSIL